MHQAWHARHAPLVAERAGAALLVTGTQGAIVAALVAAPGLRPVVVDERVLRERSESLSAGARPRQRMHCVPASQRCCERSSRLRRRRRPQRRARRRRAPRHQPAQCSSQVSAAERARRLRYLPACDHTAGGALRPQRREWRASCRRPSMLQTARIRDTPEGGARLNGTSLSTAPYCTQRNGLPTGSNPENAARSKSRGDPRCFIQRRRPGRRTPSTLQRLARCSATTHRASRARRARRPRSLLWSAACLSISYLRNEDWGRSSREQQQKADAAACSADTPPEQSLGSVQADVTSDGSSRGVSSAILRSDNITFRVKAAGPVEQSPRRFLSLHRAPRPLLYAAISNS